LGTGCRVLLINLFLKTYSLLHILLRGWGMKKGAGIGIILAAGLALFAGCEFFAGPDTPFGGGSLVVSAGTGAGRAVYTDEENNGFRYVFSFSGPGGMRSTGNFHRGRKPCGFRWSPGNGPSGLKPITAITYRPGGGV
jgi:hypothetical protein